jgi:hypothetical protein
MAISIMSSLINNENNENENNGVINVIGVSAWHQRINNHGIINNVA